MPGRRPAPVLLRPENHGHLRPPAEGKLTSGSLQYKTSSGAHRDVGRLTTDLCKAPCTLLSRACPLCTHAPSTMAGSRRYSRTTVAH